MNPYLTLSEEVETALNEGYPVVALESTIIAHGMPYPDNVQTALNVEQIIREEGAIPATIAIINGQLIVGLNKEQLEWVAQAPEVIKVSRRDLPWIVAQKKHGATTVASTMIIAEMAGIQVFVTGGIGGVHRGATETLDISADLTELARTNVAVVSAGAKSILDLALTLEYLETWGVPVIGYQTEEFPAFYTRNSGLPVDYQVNSLAELASLIQTKWELGLKGGVVVANPIPEEYQLDPALIQQVIEAALQEARQLGVKGKLLTPFLLDKIKQITHGKSLEANVNLVYNNAKIGAGLAVNMNLIN
ncbi:pseudouridine-5'-phosphate glycosidase [Rapidithrix thailandica]|uniref:Pseudouridine-5'-phosphate glycosidase n=1 Tax=Rapidithrix thailandica TaxID=413964 RepID=A0AAW9S376_9BACT